MELPVLTELYRNPREIATNRSRCGLCYNLCVSNNSSAISAIRGKRLKRLAVLLISLAFVLIITGCGGSSSSSSGSTTSGVQHRVFLTNTFSGNLQVVNGQNDTTNYTAQTVNSAGQVVPGVPVTVTVGGSPTYSLTSPDRTKTLIYDQASNTIDFLNNAAETVTNSVALGGFAQMALFSPDGTTVYAPVQSAVPPGGRPGAVFVISVATATVTTFYAVPSARYIAISPSGQYLFVFANNSDSLYLIDLKASTVTPVAIPGFAAPVNAFFSSDSTTAYVLNCGPECGSTGPASVSQFNIAAQTIGATVAVGGASVGLMNNGTLYLAGTPVPPGTNSTYDAVTVSNMTLLTPNHVPIGDGYHDTMALSTNNQLYIGASTCNNTVIGCLSIVDITTNAAAPAIPPRGFVTSLLAIPGRNVVYVIEGGFIHIYDTTINNLGPTQLIFTGPLYSAVQVDQ
jgi:hypothetical protein